MSETVISYLLTIDLEEATSHAREYERYLIRILNFSKKLGLPENINTAVREMERLTWAARTLQIGLTLLETADIASGNPLAILRAIAGGTAVISGALMTNDALYDIERGT